MLTMDREQIKLLLSGKYIEINKTFNQETHRSFVDGGIFIFDLINNVKKKEVTENGKKLSEIYREAAQESKN